MWCSTSPVRRSPHTGACSQHVRLYMFTAELFGAMKESDTGGVVHIEDMEPRVFKALLYFVYTDLFPMTKTTKEVEEGVVEAEEGNVVDDDDDEGVFFSAPTDERSGRGRHRRRR